MNAAVIPSKREYSGETMTDEFELPLFDFSTIVVATDNFADVNKLGQGGFGCVYKVHSNNLCIYNTIESTLSDRKN